MMCGRALSFLVLLLPAAAEQPYRSPRAHAWHHAPRRGAVKKQHVVPELQQFYKTVTTGERITAAKTADVSASSPSMASLYSEQGSLPWKTVGAWEQEVADEQSKRSSPVPAPARKSAAMLQEAKAVRSKQDAAATAAATFDDSKHTVALSDSFSTLEHEDEADVVRFHREDVAARKEAQTKYEVPLESPEKLKSRQVQFSKVFSALEQQDDQIQSSLKNTDDLGVYSPLSKLQDKSMAMLSQQLATAEKQPPKPSPLLKRDDLSFEAKQIHDAWSDMEKDDSKFIKNLKRDPNLRLIQKTVNTRH